MGIRKQTSAPRMSSFNLCYPAFMSTDETELEMVQRHVREGEGHLAGQRACIARLKASDLPTKQAEALLCTFQDLQRQHVAHLAHIEGNRE